MKSRTFCLILAVFSICCVANASDRVHVIAIEKFMTASPASTIDVKVIETSTLGTDILHIDDVIHCDVVEIINPKRGKRAASFRVVPISYTHDGNMIIIKEKFYGKYSEKVLSKEELKNIDAAKVGKKTALTIGNHFIKGIAPVASLTEGMVKNEEGNRLKSGVKQVYKDSVFSYAEKGKNLVIEPGQQFYLIFKPAESDDNDDNT